MKYKLAITIFLAIGMSVFISMNARSQILISLLLGDKLNTGQIEFGLTGGYGLAQIFNEPDSKHLNTFFLGFYFDFLLKKEKNWYLNTGVLVKSRMGASGIPIYDLDDPEMDSVFDGGSINRKISYFNVPIEIKYRFKNNFFVDAGCQLGLRYTTNDEFVNTVENKDDLTYAKDIRDEINRIDAGVAGGFGYKFMKGMGMSIGVRYYFGLVNIYKDTRNGNNSVLYLHVEIPIGANKKKKNEPNNVE